MVTVPGFLLRRLYVKQSLKNTTDGFEFRLLNRLGSGYAFGMRPLTLEGRELPIDSASFDLDGEIIGFDEVSQDKTFTLAMNKSITIRVTGISLEPGPHKSAWASTFQGSALSVSTSQTPSTMDEAVLRIAVTGASGYVAGRLIRRLQKSDGVDTILATDIGPPTIQYSRKVKFMSWDVTAPCPDLFARHRIDAVVHLAYVLNPAHRKTHARMVNVTGTDNVLDACENAGVRHVIYLSSTSVYGAHPDNPPFLTEDDPIRPIKGFQYSEDKAAAEARLSTFAEWNPSAAVTVLRVCPVMGPNADNFIAGAFRKPLLPAIGGADPPMQFLHEDDLISVLTQCLEQRPAGTLQRRRRRNHTLEPHGRNNRQPYVQASSSGLVFTHFSRMASQASERLPRLWPRLHPLPLDSQFGKAQGRPRH